MLKHKMEEEGIGRVDERLVWRRWCIYNNCGNGSDADRVGYFKQEYPSIPEEAFKATGDTFFDKNEVVRQLNLCKEPLFLADIVKIDSKYELRKSSEGHFKFYEEPSKGWQCCIGGDASSGSGLDYSTLVARRKDTNNVVATFRGLIDPDELAEKSAMLGNFLNECTIAIENDKFGFAANRKLKQIYGKVFYQVVINKKRNIRKKEFGWNTTSVTRPAMLSQMQEEIRETATQLRDKVLLKECLTFIRNEETGKVEAQEGCNDDFVIANAICGMVRQLDPYKPDFKKKAKQKPEYARAANAGFGF